MKAEDLFPVYEVLPPAGFEVRGQIEPAEDGWCLAYWGQEEGSSVPYAVSVEVPSSILFRWEWPTLDAYEKRHDAGGWRPWCGVHDLDVTEDLDDEWGAVYRRHPVAVAHDAAMRECCDRFRCANGRSLEIRNPLEVPLFAGQVRLRETRELVIVSENLQCDFGCKLEVPPPRAGLLRFSRTTA